MPLWIDLADKATGARLRVSRIEDNTYLFITGLSNKSGKWSSAVERLGFVSGGNGRFLIRRVRHGERPAPSDFRLVWPNARIVEMQPQEYLLDLTSRSTPRASGAQREIVDHTRNARRLGRNLQAEEVYECDLGRFIWRDRIGAVFEADGHSPALFLRAADAHSLAQCADGYVQSMRVGEVQHSEDFEAFRHAAGAAPDPEARSALHSAIDAAVIRYLRREYETAQDAYGESVRMYELLPPYSGAPRGDAAMPVPLSVLAQRLLGDTRGKRVVYPQAYDGAAFAFLPQGTMIHACRGGRDLWQDAVGLTQMRRDEVQWSDDFIPARHAGSDAIFFNADRRWDRGGERLDLRDALMACRALAEGGRAVLVLAGDDPRQPGRIAGASTAFMRTLGERYSVEEVFELGVALAGRVGTHTPLRLISLRNMRAQSNSWRLMDDRPLDVLHSWDAVKSRIDEAIARVNLAEVGIDSVSVERATEVNRLQAPYLAYSRVGESRTMVPRNLQAPMQAALAEIEAQNGPVDPFVERELSLGENTLAECFSPEQVDALALIVARIKRGRAAILADETGVGKGRTLAALCTWALKQGRPVVFVTDRANLFSDLTRDLRDIGEWGRVRPLITNSDGHIVEMVHQRADRDGQPQSDLPPQVNVLAKAVPPARMQEIVQGNLGLQQLSVNVVFTTYSQIAGEESDKATWIKNQLADALLVVDEAHVAAGSDSSIARQVTEMSSMAWSVVFSSATWAKTPDNLHVYSRAFPESVNVASLTETIRRGGDAFSEVFSTMLARDGALIRREHDLSRLEFVLEIDADNLERNRRVADAVSAAMGQISLVSGEIDHLMFQLSRSSLQALRAARGVRQAVVGNARGARVIQGETASLFRSSFGAGSMLYQVQRRMNAALNVDNVVRLATRAIEEGRKPVIVFDETTEAFVRRAIERASLRDAQGNVVRSDVVEAPTLRDLLRRAVEDLVTVRVSQVTWQEVQAADAAGRNLLEEFAQQDDPAVAVAAPEAAHEPEPRAAQHPERHPEQATVAGPGVTGTMPETLQEPVATQGTQAHEVGQTQTSGAGDAGAAGIDVDVAVRSADVPPQPGRSSRLGKPSVRRLRLDQLPGLSDQQRLAFQEGIRQIDSLIDQIPPIAISVADEIHHRLRRHGLRTGEISGRSFMLEPVVHANRQGLCVVRTRSKSKLMVNRTVDGFNSHELDAIVINRSAATGLSLHASPRFIDHRRRELIEAQPPENPTERVQLYGRVNRYDQLSQPRVSIAATGIPGETRHLMMQNKKLAALNANVRSSRESHAIISSVVDLLNPLGRDVCRQFFLDNPLYATRMAQDLDRIERKEVDAASAFTRYVSLLPVVQQDMLYEQINQLFEEAVLKAELAGENPLKPREHDWRARTVAQDVLFGIDHGGLGSAFDGPVYVRALQYEQVLRPMPWAQVQAAIGQSRRKLVESGFATEVGLMLNEARDPIISIAHVAQKIDEQLDGLARSALTATRFVTAAEALAAAGPNPVKRGMARRIWLQRNLHKLVPGARVSLPHPSEHFARMGATVPHVLVEVIPPKQGREALLAQWKLMLLRAGQERPVAHSLNSLLTQVEYVSSHDPQRPDQLIGEAVSPVQVGGDVLMASQGDRTSDGAIVRAFDAAPAGVRRRMASVLAGNMYLAAEFASQAKVGESVLYTDDRGMKHRAILLGGPFGGGFEAGRLRHMPVRVWVRRAMEEFLLSLSGLGPGQVRRDEHGAEVAGEPPCETNGPPGQQAFWLHTSFARAWARESGGAHALGHDDLFVYPGKGMALVAGKEQHRRLSASLRAAQERIRQEQHRQEQECQDQQRAAPGSQVTSSGASLTTAPHDEATTSQSQQLREGRDERDERDVRESASATARKRLRACDDPAHVVISASETSQRWRARGEAQFVTLRADTPARMRRAIRMLVEGTGLQLYVPRNHAVGHYARQLVRDDLIRRLRLEIGNQPDKLARLEEQIERMDTEAAASRRGFLGLTQRTSVEEDSLVEVRGQVVAERDLFDQDQRQHEQIQPSATAQDLGSGDAVSEGQEARDAGEHDVEERVDVAVLDRPA